MCIKYSDPSKQYGLVDNFINRETIWNKFGKGRGKYGIDFLEPKGGELVLDIGSGTGSDVLKLGEKLGENGKIFAIDISEPLLKKAKQKNQLNERNSLFILATINYIPFSSGLFDIVIVKHVLNHVDDIEYSLNEIKRTLKDDGRIVITTGVKTLDSDLLRTIHSKAINAIGIKTNVRLSRTAFNCENAEEYLGAFFKHVEYHYYEFKIIFLMSMPLCRTM